jgi:serine protease SohB
MEFLTDFGLFASKTLFISLSIIAIIVVAAVMSQKSHAEAELEVTPLHKKFKRTKKQLEQSILSKKQIKEKAKADKKKSKDEDLTIKPRLYVIDFHGDIKANAAESLSHEVSALLSVATEKDEVLVRLESPGGVVHGYGYAASQLLRIRSKKIPLVVSVDKVAASGGYMMACTAQKIISAPFGIVGSIGVIAQVPNFNRLLKKNDVDYKEYTAGQFKRTVSILGEITAAGEQKFVQQLEETHVLFKEFVGQNRPQVDLQSVATGEYWYGVQALKLNLVDEVKTSDDWIMDRIETHDIFQLKYEKKLAWREKLSGILGLGLQKGFEASLQKLEERRFL